MTRVRESICEPKVVFLSKASKFCNSTSVVRFGQEYKRWYLLLSAEACD